MRCKLAVTRRGLAAAALAGALLLPAAAGAKTYPKAENPTVLSVPAIPGAPALPGPVAPAATPASSVTPLNVTPLEGVAGTPLTISASGLPANKPVTVTWSTANVSWEVETLPSTISYLGRASTSVTVVLATATTNASGSFSVIVKAPEDFGGPHEIYADVEGVQQAFGLFTMTRTVTMSPKKGPVGTPITLTYRGIGPTLYEGGAVLSYDNHYTGVVTANWTRGTAQVKIRAAGTPGKHTIQITNAIGEAYLNVPQSPQPWTTGFTLTFKVTKGKARPKPEMEWPVSVAPTDGARTTVQVAGLGAAGGAAETLAPTSGQVETSVNVSASGLASSPVELVWSTVRGNRVNCKGICWVYVSVPLGSATPTAGSLNTKVTVPNGLGGWHVVQLVQGGQVVAQQPFYVKESVVGNGVSSLVLKEGQRFTVHLEGVGWTQLDNQIAVDYDNSYVGYGCGFNSNGDTLMDLVATGGPGVHLVDIYPLISNLSPAFAESYYGQLPILTYARDEPALALGYQLPAIRLAVTVVK
jgi:hypothetical protein